MSKLDRRNFVHGVVAAGALTALGCTPEVEPVAPVVKTPPKPVDVVLAVERLDRSPWPTDDPFLFCAYHLGITEDNGYRKPRARDIAKRFDVSINEMHDAMQRLQIDKNSFERYNFDLSLAQLDIRVAPEGVDRREIAKVHYNELCELNPGLGQEVE